ncbi:hypothetical protein CVU37_06815 [candidate division BRC1 bacterium HGW-BRC1-1]|jgi:hypothetical protein|nr:MAG: hypothetical protein CVU37_06815 [candidate division BRC1 bacterium HGW-BRC1-1]
MSENYALPSIENALILLADFSHHVGEGIPPSVGKALDAAVKLEDQTVYLFFEPAEREDDVLRWLEPWGDDVVTAALLPGSVAGHLRAVMRRIFSRNETRKAVAAFVGDQTPISESTLRAAFAGLDSANVVVSAAEPLLGLTAFHDWVFAPEVWEGGASTKVLGSKAAEAGLQFKELVRSKES